MALYYFIDAAGERKLIGSGNIRWAGAWSGSTSYQIRDAASDGTGHFWMTLVANTNVAIPSTFDSSVPTTWTHLVQAEASSLSPEDQAIATAAEAMALSTAALSTSWAGTTTANYVGTSAGVAYDLARLALNTAWYGTASAREAEATATAAISTAWVGTLAASGAQSQGDAAMAVATAALSTSWAGTGGGGVTTLAWTTEIVNLDFGTLTPHVVINAIEGNIQITSTNQSAGKTTWVLIDNSDGYLRDISFPGWVFVWENSALSTPTQIQAATYALMELASFGPNDGDLMARWRTYTNPG